MTNSERTRQELADMGVEVLSMPQLTRKAIASADGYLAVGNMEDSREDHTVLTHEKWHFKLGAFYRAGASYTDRLRCEGAVDRAALRELVPKERLTALLRRGRTLEEIADTLDITPALVVQAWEHYRQADPTLWRVPED